MFENTIWNNDILALLKTRARLLEQIALFPSKPQREFQKYMVFLEFNKME